MKTIGPWIVVLLIIGWLFSNLNHVQPSIPQTPTPIPGYVAGEEIEAYTSFVKYYDKEVYECRNDPGFTGGRDYAYSVDKNYSGKAVYVGDSIWRFYIRVETRDVTDLSSVDDPSSYQEKVIEVKSLTDRTWENICNPYNPNQNTEPDYGPSEDPVEPPDPSWS